MLYDVLANCVTFREDYRYFGRAFFPYLGELFATGLSRVAPHYGHTGMPQRKSEAGKAPLCAAGGIVRFSSDV